MGVFTAETDTRGEFVPLIVEVQKLVGVTVRDDKNGVDVDSPLVVSEIVLVSVKVEIELNESVAEKNCEKEIEVDCVFVTLLSPETDDDEVKLASDDDVAVGRASFDPEEVKESVLDNDGLNDALEVPVLRIVLLIEPLTEFEGDCVRDKRGEFDDVLDACFEVDTETVGEFVKKGVLWEEADVVAENICEVRADAEGEAVTESVVVPVLLTRIDDDVVGVINGEEEYGSL